MLIDFSQPILDLKGQPAKENGDVITLGYVATTSLQLPDGVASDAEKIHRFKLAAAIATATTPVTMTLEDAAIVKRAIGRHPLPLAVARAYELLEQSA